MLVNAKGGGGKTFAVNVILARCLAHGMRGYVLDRAGHYAFLCSLIPGARHLTIGAAEDEHAVNPWDVADPARPPAEKITYLVGLHALLVGDHQRRRRLLRPRRARAQPARGRHPRRLRARRARAARAARVAAARRAAPPRRRRRPRPARARSPRSCARWPSGSPRSAATAPTPTCSTARPPYPPTRRWWPSTPARCPERSRRRCCSCSPSTSPSSSSGKPRERLYDRDAGVVRRPLGAGDRRGLEARRAPRHRRVGQRPRPPRPPPRPLPGRDLASSCPTSPASTARR